MKDKPSHRLTEKFVEPCRVAGPPSVQSIRVVPGRVLKTTPVFDTYWRFAVLRQDIFMRRVKGEAPPWTDDPVAGVYRFTNAYRASDRVSQYLIRHVIYEGSQIAEDIFFRILLFKFFNRIDTWKKLEITLGEISWEHYNFERFASALDNILSDGERIYSAAYIMPSPAFGCRRKHRNHLRLLEYIMQDKALKKIACAKSLETVFEILKSYRSIGPFLAFQFAIDLNYSELIDFSEMDFVVAGPGAKDGIRKCFIDSAGFDKGDIIRIMAERAENEFARLGIVFQSLWGRPLQLIDYQNLFCEVDKYSRIVHPCITAAAGRTRIKQKFRQNPTPIPQWYPPKWNIIIPTAT